jgi:hypothetical protein
MRKSWMVGAAAMLALGGCEDGAPEPKRTVMKAANPTSEGLKKLHDLYRFLGLRRAIVDNGQRCKKVDRGHYQQEYQTMAMWTAHCTDSGDWAIFIAPSGEVQVRRCGNAATLGLPLCKPIPGPAAAEGADGNKTAAAAN